MTDYSNYVRPKPKLICEDESRTQQHFKEECDINVIMKRWTRTGYPSEGDLMRGTPSFGDFSNVADYLEASCRVREAIGAFESLPSKVRELAEGDPAKFLEMVHTEEGKAALLEVGLDPEWVPASAVSVEEGTPSPEEAPATE